MILILKATLHVSGHHSFLPYGKSIGKMYWLFEIWTNHCMQGTKLGNMIDQTWVLHSRSCTQLRKLKLKNLYLFFIQHIFIDTYYEGYNSESACAGPGPHVPSEL